MQLNTSLYKTKVYAEEEFVLEELRAMHTCKEGSFYKKGGLDPTDPVLLQQVLDEKAKEQAENPVIIHMNKMMNRLEHIITTTIRAELQAHMEQVAGTRITASSGQSLYSGAPIEPISAYTISGLPSDNLDQAIERCEDLEALRRASERIVDRLRLLSGASDEAFRISVRKFSTAKLGLTFRISESAMFIAIIHDDGLISNWNKEHPDLQVKVGDQIMEVNGKRESTDDMLTTMRSDEVLQMVIKPCWQDALATRYAEQSNLIAEHGYQQPEHMNSFTGVTTIPQTGHLNHFNLPSETHANSRGALHGELTQLARDTMRTEFQQLRMHLNEHAMRSDPIATSVPNSATVAELARAITPMVTNELSRSWRPEFGTVPNSQMLSAPPIASQAALAPHFVRETPRLVPVMPDGARPDLNPSVTIQKSFPGYGPTV